MLRLIYAHKLHGWTKLTEGQSILFRYPPPVGTMRVILRSNAGSDNFVFGEVFDHGYYDFDLPTLPKTILDLGANAGYSAIFFSRKYPQASIACVEPMPQNVAVLRQNLLLNDIQARVFAAAIAVEDGPIQMETNVRDYGHKVAINGLEISGALVSCEGISVPSLMKQMGWERIGLLKMDIEGYERLLLTEKCEWLKWVDSICVEIHEGYDEADLKEMAATHGFDQPRCLRGIWLVLSKSS